MEWKMRRRQRKAKERKKEEFDLFTFSKSKSHLFLKIKKLVLFSNKWFGNFYLCMKIFRLKSLLFLNYSFEIYG